MVDLFSSLKEYKIITEKLIECIDKDNFDNLKELLDKRDELINSMQSTNFDKSDFGKIVNELDIVSLQSTLDSKMTEKKRELLDKINGINKNKIANQNYYKNNYEDSLLFNKKI